jgi:hypothetical protein
LVVAGCRLPADEILVAVRWYLRSRLSYRDVEKKAMLHWLGQGGLPRSSALVGSDGFGEFVERSLPIEIVAVFPFRDGFALGALAWCGCWGDVPV